MRALGRHLIVEYTNCSTDVLNDIVFLENSMLEAAALAGTTIVKSVFHQYSPQGISGVVVIAESHMSIHTWPEYNYAAVDFFTCGQETDPLVACMYMKEKLQSDCHTLQEIVRGIPSIVDEVLEHK